MSPRGESEFSTLAILYSEAPESVRGGEIGFKGRAELVPEYAAVAFNLQRPQEGVENRWKPSMVPYRHN